MYKYEMHLHTQSCSACARSSAEEMVSAIKECGFTGLVITNHFFHGNTAIDRKLPWRDFAECYAEDYYRARDFGLKNGVDVLFGLEEGLGNGKEALIYGLSPETVIDEPAMRDMNLRELADFVHSNGGLIYAAHPFRQREYIKFPHVEPDMSCFDSIEVYNRGNTDIDNQTAYNFAKKHGLLGIAGSDAHSAANLGLTGLAFDRRITTNQELITALKAKNYKFVIDGNIME